MFHHGWFHTYTAQNQILLLLLILPNSYIKKPSENKFTNLNTMPTYVVLTRCTIIKLFCIVRICSGLFDLSLDWRKLIALCLFTLFITRLTAMAIIFVGCQFNNNSFFNCKLLQSNMHYCVRCYIVMCRYSLVLRDLA